MCGRGSCAAPTLVEFLEEAATRSPLTSRWNPAFRTTTEAQSARIPAAGGPAHGWPSVEQVDRKKRPRSGCYAGRGVSRARR
jgi:hypothetical protein